MMLAVCFSCAAVNKVAVKSTAGVIYAGSNELLKENDYQLFKESTPANLKFLEGLWASDRSNKKLLTLLIKGYAAYTFAVLETEALRDILLEEDSPAKERVVLTYEKAINYGIMYLAELGISKDEFLDKSFPEKMSERLNEKASQDDLVALFYFMQALGSSINLQRDSIEKMAYFSHVINLLDWVCTKDPTLEFGNCELFGAVIEASTPLVLGGSKPKAQKKFKKVLKSYPSNLLARLSYVQYYLLPMLEEDEYAKEMKALSRSTAKWYSVQMGESIGTDIEKQGFISSPEYNLYNSLAKRRLSIFKSVEKDIF